MPDAACGLCNIHRPSGGIAAEAASYKTMGNCGPRRNRHAPGFWGNFTPPLKEGHSFPILGVGLDDERHSPSRFANNRSIAAEVASCDCGTRVLCHPLSGLAQIVTL